MILYVFIVSLLLVHFSFEQVASINPKLKTRSLYDHFEYALDNNFRVKDASLKSHFTEVGYQSFK